MSTNTSKYTWHDDNNNGHKASSVIVHTLHLHKTSLWNSGSDCVCGCIPVNFNASLCDISYSCRATEWPFYFGFITPFILLHVFDWIMFIVILASIIKHKKNITQSKDVRESQRDNVIIALSLAVVFGLGWGFGLLTTSSSIRALTATFQAIFSIFVGAQGVLLFLLHGLRNSDVRELWKGWLTSFVSTTGITPLCQKKFHQDLRIHQHVTNLPLVLLHCLWPCCVKEHYSPE